MPSLKRVKIGRSMKLANKCSFDKPRHVRYAAMQQQLECVKVLCAAKAATRLSFVFWSFWDGAIMSP